MTLRRSRASVFFAAVLAARAFAAGASDQPQSPPSQPPAAPATPSARYNPLYISDAVIAIVEDRIITSEDLAREFEPRLEALNKRAHNQLEFDQLTDELSNDLLNELINRILIVKEFQKDTHRHIPASYVDNDIAETLQAAPYNGDRAYFLAYLKSNGWTERDYRTRVEENIIYNVMRNQQHQNESVVSPARIEIYYQQNQSKFYKEESAHSRLIGINRQPGETDAQLLLRLQPIMARLKAGEKFDAVARTVSQDISRSRGGDLGWQIKSDMRKEFADPLFKLAVGETSDPIVEPNGACYLIYMEAHTLSGIQPLADVSVDIEKILAAQMAREAENQWFMRLRSTAYVSYVGDLFGPPGVPGAPEHPSTKQ